MNKRQLSILTDAERMLVLETEPTALAALDEDGLVELHDRIRRTRTKYTGQYRRGGAVKVSAKGGRGKASEQNQRARDKAEVFEDALARVSARLARAARATAADLKAQRLAAARSTAAAPTPVRSPRTVATKAAPTRRTRNDSSAVAKKNASTLAAGARRQAARDSR